MSNTRSMPHVIDATITSGSPKNAPCMRWDIRDGTLLVLILMLGMFISCLPSSPVTASLTRAPYVAHQALETSMTSHIPQCVSGYVLSGGDTTPQGLTDAPRKFVYSVKTDDGSEVRVSYTAYPPSPAQPTRRIRLHFHAGTILIGDYLKACGRYDPGTRILVVAEPGDYIETYPQKS